MITTMAFIKGFARVTIYVCGRSSRWVVYQLIVIHIKNAALAPTELGGCRKSAFSLPQDEAGTSAVQNTN